MSFFLLVLSSFFLSTKFMISRNFDQGRGGLTFSCGEEGAFQGGGDRLLLFFFFNLRYPTHPSKSAPVKFQRLLFCG